MTGSEEPKDSAMNENAMNPTNDSEHAKVETVDARKLLGGSNMLRIELDGELYTLRVTRNNRLILTK